MKKLKVVTVVGTRPEIIRLSEILKELDRVMDHVLIHTGQNYDYELSKIFFEDLGLREPDHILETAGTSPSENVGRVISSVDALLADIRPDAFLVLGDTNSCMAAYAAKRRKIPVFHMEAGNRCFDQRVPEEINRRIIDHLADINLTYSELARGHLLREGIPADRIINTGSPVFEVLAAHKKSIEKSDVLKRLDVKKESYFLASFHREENVTNKERLSQIINALRDLSEQYAVPVIIPAHPRTAAFLEASHVESSDLFRIMKPIGFFDFVHLEQNATCVLSDSGTLNEEASALNFPAVHLRDSHERPEGMDEGFVVMSGLTKGGIVQSVELTLAYAYGDIRTFSTPAAYSVPNVSKKVPKIIQSYVEYVNRRVWMK